MPPGSLAPPKMMKLGENIETKVLDGLINFHKPIGITSAKALYRVRSITGQRKSGHAGTLDPGASGVLILCLGKATKMVEKIMELPKVYRATARLDVTSESFDSDRPLEPVAVASIPTKEAIRMAFGEFEGTNEQVPPTVSAIKIGGRPAYKMNRDEAATELAARPVRIDWVRVLAYDWPNVDFELCCGRGTYVRALIRDLGRRLGAGGCLTSLCRSRVGPFQSAVGDLEWRGPYGENSVRSLPAPRSAWTFERLQQHRPEDYLIPIERARELIASDAALAPARPQGA